MSRAPSMILAVETAMAALTPSAYQAIGAPVAGFGENNATAFTAMDSMREFGASGMPREFIVSLNFGSAAEDTIITAGDSNGTGDWFLRVVVVTRHRNDGMRETLFHALVADDHRIIMDGVLRKVRQAAPAGLNDIRLGDGGVSMEFDEQGQFATSFIPFTIVYRDTVA